MAIAIGGFLGTVGFFFKGTVLYIRCPLASRYHILLLIPLRTVGFCWPRAERNEPGAMAVFFVNSGMRFVRDVLYVHSQTIS